MKRQAIFVGVLSAIMLTGCGSSLSDEEQQYIEEVDESATELEQLDTHLTEAVNAVEDEKEGAGGELQSMQEDIFVTALDNVETISVPEGEDMQAVYNAHVSYANQYVYVAEELMSTENLAQSVEENINPVLEQAEKEKNNFAETVQKKTGEEISFK
ncbi:hypothetical protein CHL76_12790 [Marinococcus halophilus]|uniref:Lipoprotein n=1 Tax=Marinococcus halophilus TaxID=1371 RepID=A0A510YAW6_MARHA|nr:hypothetical protein [Marinococcus halophilus]OZT79435.1 hypothetical protein CHL76_12790 [Marinococcus halophilus]GEK59517.1 hypothetical protein MHA01_24220 [Marinococcus halophilus]